MVVFLHQFSTSGFVMVLSYINLRKKGSDISEALCLPRTLFTEILHFTLYSTGIINTLRMLQFHFLAGLAGFGSTCLDVEHVSLV